MKTNILILLLTIFLNCTYSEGYSVGRINYISKDNFCGRYVVGLSIGNQEQKTFLKQATITSEETKEKLLSAYRQDKLIKFKYNSDTKLCGPLLNILEVIEIKQGM